MAISAPPHPTTWACAECGFYLYHPLRADLLVSESGLYSDARFPGRAIVALHGHAESLEELAERDLADFWTDILTVGRAVKAVTSCTRINYAVLGNAERHLHAHLIPRDSAVDPLPTRPPWNDPRDLTELSDERLRELAGGIERLLDRSGS